MRATIQDEAGRLIGIIDADPKSFKTGNKGFFGVAKLRLNGTRYQAQLQMVEIKPKEKD